MEIQNDNYGCKYNRSYKKVIKDKKQNSHRFCVKNAALDLDQRQQNLGINLIVLKCVERVTAITDICKIKYISKILSNYNKLSKKL